ncbi:MAG: ribosome small subunit-dependent GTPase A [Oceanicaulis sp.]
MTSYTLFELGVRPAMLAHLNLDAESPDDLARVAAVHRDALEVLTQAGPARLRHAPFDDPLDRPTVGDLILLDRALERPARVLPRSSLFKRKAAGMEAKVQLIAANIDTGFIVSSCDADFKPARLERYLAMVREAGAEAVILLTKADLADPAPYLGAVRAIAGDALVEAVNALDAHDLARLSPWTGAGQTAALIGSSGVGKTTLVNTLTGAGAVTAGIREDDAKGRHTTRGRTLHRMEGGGWLIDTPGLRELALADVEAGLKATFEDLAELETRCRFSDCAHLGEPGCAVAAALEAGEIDPERWRRFEKLKREAARNDATLKERRDAYKAQGKLYKRIQSEHRTKKGG